MANEIDALMDAGMLITHATLQNEPDGHVENPPTSQVRRLPTRMASSRCSSPAITSYAIG